MFGSEPSSLGGDAFSGGLGMRFLLASILGLFLLAAASEPADARRIRIPIPGFSHGSGEQLVKVLELPRIPELQREDGTPIDLGYLFRRDGSGEWIGHVGSDRSYLKLKPEFLPVLMALAGRDELPPIPARAGRSTSASDTATASADATGGSGVSNGLWMLLVLVGFGVMVVRVFRKVMGFGRSASAVLAKAIGNEPVPAAQAAERRSAWMDKAAQQMDQQASSPRPAAPAVPRALTRPAVASTAAAPVRQPRAMAFATSSARPAFGRRS